MKIHISDYWNLAHELEKPAGIYQVSPNRKCEATLFFTMYVHLNQSIKSQRSIFGFHS